MKYLSALIVLLLASPAAFAQSGPTAGTSATETTQQEPLTAKEADRRARLAKRNNAAEVYKGTLAQQRRIIIDAPDAQLDPEPEEESGKRSRGEAKYEANATVTKP